MTRRETDAVLRHNRRSTRAIIVWSFLLTLWPGARARAQHQDYQAGPPAKDLTAFTGLANAPEADLFFGASRTSIPIDVPPGRKQMTPKLAVTYGSQGGPSPYGYGWALPLGRIQRSSRLGVLTCSTLAHKNDFVLVLPEQSVEFTRNASGRGIPRIEESFLKIQHDAAQNVWTVWDRGGTKYRFGESAHARTGSDISTIYTSTSCNQTGLYAPTYTFSWELTSVEDPDGNRLEIQYTPNINVSDGVAYPERILYGGHSNGFAHQFEIDLNWNDARPVGDDIVTGVDGFATRLTRLLSEIVVRRATGGTIIRRYAFAYETDVDAPRLGRQTFLSAVTLYDGSNQALTRYDGLPASTTFLYQQPEMGQLHFGGLQISNPVQLINGIDFSYARDSDNLTTDSDRDMFDITGDGIADWVIAPPLSQCQSNPFWYVFRGGVAGFAPTPMIWQARSCLIRDGHSAGNSPRHTYTDQDTVDLNGDNIPDFIDTTPWTSGTQVWNVYLGYVTATGGGFVATPIVWNAPREELRHTVSADVSAPALGYSTAPGSVDFRDLIDMNGDGLPDLVDVEGAANGTWRVWVNTGNGFDATGRDFPVSLPGVSVLRWTRGRDEIIGIRDMNGDGLPDQVFAGYGNITWPGYWYVFLNSGPAMDIVEQWPIPAAVGGRYIRRMSADYRDVLRDVFDINGDGLPDIVDGQSWVSGSGLWQVVLNRGDGFSTDALAWTSPQAAVRHGGNDRTYADTMDIDGDGFVDYVSLNGGSLWITRNPMGAWCGTNDGVSCTNAIATAGVAANPDGTRPDLLVQVENGLGGTTELEYRPSTQWDNTGGDGVSDLPFTLWTVTRIARDDGLCDAAGVSCISSGAHTLITNVAYQNGRFDPSARQLRGFQVVSSRDADGTTPPVQGRTTYFHQGAALLGKVTDSWTYDAAGGGQFFAPFTRTQSTWQCVNPATGVAITCPTQPNGDVWIRLSRTDDYVFNNFLVTSSKHASREIHTWSQCGGKFYGNIAHYSAGDASGSPRVHSHADYACVDSATAYVVDRPMHTWTATSDDSTTLQEEWLFYDAQGQGVVTRGDLTRRERWLDQPTGAVSSCSAAAKQCVATQMSYDAYGNIVSIVDALGRTTTTQYDTMQIYPSIVTAPAPFLHKTATAYDPSCGALLWQSITYVGATVPTQRSERRYDSFCRLIATAQPDENISSAPHESYYYSPGGAQHASRVTMLEREPGSPSGFINTHALTDALGRTIQQQQTRAVDGNYAFVATATTEYDSRGNIRALYAPFITSTPAAYSAPPQTIGVTHTDFDALNRPVHVTNPDGTARDIDHLTAWQTITRDECFNSASCAGGQTTEVRDALGRVIEKKLYDEATFRTRTVYTYDELGRLLSARQGSSDTTLNDATRMTIAYDTLGRRTQMTDPDSGVWHYGYDAAGNMRYQDDPKSGQHLQFCYDGLDRITLECPLTADYSGTLINCGSAACASSDAVHSTYDATNVAFGLGRLTRVVDASGETRFDEYDVRGRLRQVTKEVDALGDGQNVTTAVTAYAYDVADHLTQLTYPDGELVQYTYDAGGQVKRLRSLTHQVDYVSNATYDLFGRSAVLTHGNGAVDTRSYGGANANYRLAQLATNSGSALRLSYSYPAYLPTGRLAQIVDNGPKGEGGAMDNSATFAYDGLGRMTQATSTPLGTSTYQYNYLGNMTTKEGMTLAYSAAKPHTLTQINGSATGIAHDGNGNRLGKPTQSYAYDHHDRLTQINSGQTRYRYDYTGRRVAKITAGAPVTVYYSTLAESSSGSLTKYYFVGNQLVASRRGQASGFAALPPRGIRLASTSLDRPMLTFLVRHDVRSAALAVLTAGAIGLLLAPQQRKRNVGIAIRSSDVVFVTVAVAGGTFPWPWTVRPAEAQFCAPAASVVYHLHSDHMGSIQLITNSSGGAVEYVRYRPYGEVRGRYDGSGASIAPNAIHRTEFSGYESDFTTGLEYAGARFYDPALGAFLTHDPAHQYANPYAYGSWSPMNGTDNNGAGFLEFIIAVIIAVVVSVAVNTIVAAAQGASLSQIGKAAVRGAITGAVGVGLGVLASGINIGSAALAGTLPSGVGVGEAVNALGDVAVRSAISTSIANAAGQTAAAAGAPSGLVTGISFAAGFLGSVGYDQLLLDPTSDLARIEGSNHLQLASNRHTHANISMAAAQDAGFTPLEGEAITNANLAQDADVWNNESHFGFAAQGQAAALGKEANAALRNGGYADFLSNAGAATHYIQDQYALGHIFPGTHLLSGPVGAPFRFLIHQTVGGEVNFFSTLSNARVPSSFSATRTFLAGLNRAPA